MNNTKMYKLTDAKMRTYNNTIWELNVEKQTDGSGELCSKGWLHCYNDPLVAIILNPIHANFDSPRLFECETGGETKEEAGKLGFTRMKLIRELPVPIITLEQRIRFGILCAKQVCSDPSWNTWADCWLDGTDRSREPAANAAWAANAAAAAAAAAAAWAAENAAWAAEAAAWAVVYATMVKKINLPTLAKEAYDALA